MRKVQVEIEGVAPLRFNKFNGMDNGADIEKRCKAKLYVDEKGVYIPADWIKGALRNTASLVKMKGSKKVWNWVLSTIFVDGQKVYTGNKKEDGVFEGGVKRPPKKGTWTLDKWPFLNAGWKAKFNLVMTDETFPMDKLQELIELAGLRTGLGDARPEWGRFRLVNMKELNGS